MTIKKLFFVLILSLGGSFSSIGENISDESLKGLMLIQADFRFTDQSDIFGLPIMSLTLAVLDLNYDEMVPFFVGTAKKPSEKNLVTRRQKAKLKV